MKLFIIFIIQIFFMAEVVSAQRSLTANSEKPDMQATYLKKRSINNNVGWTCVTGGVLIGMGGALTLLSGAVKSGSNSSKKVNAGTTIFLIGNGVALASIPFFVAAHQYKQKAQLALTAYSLDFDHVRYPGISIRMNFN